MREGSLDAPMRRPIPWQTEDYYDGAKVDAELRRVFDICHGCRRCFNLCDSFPRLFDLIDASKTGELDAVESKGFGPVVDACTLCDMCFLTKCPYVPPHAFDLDFPHLMLRARAAAFRRGEVGRFDRELAKTDRNGALAGFAAPLVNWANRENNPLTRPVLAAIGDLDPAAALPKFHYRSFEVQALAAPAVNEAAPAYGRKAVLYATCFINHNAPKTGLAARAVLAQNGVETEVIYPGCCGMPKLEQGDIAAVAASARSVAAALRERIAAGWDVIALVPSCALMLKFEWPLILPDEPDVAALAKATFDLSEYVVDIARREGLAPGMQPVEGGISVHIACHARAQNMGQKGADLLRLIPGADVQVIERCSGHGGAWGFKRGHFATALKVGRPVARQVGEGGKRFLASECPLAGVHIQQGVEKLGGAAPERLTHPIELMARAYGLQ
jgi:glycerol-3-phosphate dehydrogenase subunit C